MFDEGAPETGPEVSPSITERDARAAVVVLQKIASHYNETITYADLQDQVAGITHRPSNQVANWWADRVLGKVITICEQDGHPQLTSLVVRSSDGGVGDGFNAVLTRSGRDRIEDSNLLEVVAAEERLNCYRQFCLDMPEDAEPTLTREYKAHISRRTEPEIRRRPVCVSCGLQLPATGMCDTCD